MLATDNVMQGNVWGNFLTVRLLRITVDKKLSFDPHLSKICKGVSQNLHAHFAPSNIKSANCGSEIISQLGPKIWNLISENIKASENFNNYNSKIKFW